MYENEYNIFYIMDDTHKFGFPTVRQRGTTAEDALARLLARRPLYAREDRTFVVVKKESGAAYFLRQVPPAPAPPTIEHVARHFELD